MGYYVNIEESTWKIHDVASAYEAMCKLNHTVPNSEKRGGSYGSSIEPAPAYGPHETRWFSWMAWNYDETCDDAREILEQLGFECSIETDIDGTSVLSIDHYDSKAGQEDLFLQAIAPYSTGYIIWRGEEGDCWKNEVENGVLVNKAAKIVWA